MARARVRPWSSRTLSIGASAAVAAFMFGGLQAVPAYAAPVGAGVVKAATGVPAPLPADPVSAVAAGTQGLGAEATAPAPVKVLPHVAVQAPSPKNPAPFDPATAKVDSRASTSTDYVNADGSHTMVFSTVPVNFQDSSGVWRAVDNTLVADPDQAGGFVSKANSWKVHFGSLTQGVSVETTAGTVSVVAVGARLVAPVVSASGDAVTYVDAWPSVDLTYTVTGDSVKESVILKSRQAQTSFVFGVHSGSRASVLKGNAPQESLSAGADGSLKLGGAVGSQVSLQAPMVLRADGEPVGDAHASLSTSGGAAVLSIDPLWVAAQPFTSFPLNLDPTLGVGASSTWSFKSDGYSCSNCGLNVGNSRDSNTDRYWRSLASFPIGQIAGAMVFDAEIGTSLISGTGNGYPMYVYAPNNYNYAGAVGASPAIAAGTPMWGQNLTGAGLTAMIQGSANGGAATSVLGFAGYELAGTYTYQKYNVALYVSYDKAPTVAVPAAPSPCNTCTYHSANPASFTFAASASDPDGDPLQYYFRAATGADGETGTVYNSGWQSSATATWVVPAWLINTKLYWHVYTYDGTIQTNPNYVWSFTVTNTAPNPAGVGSPGVTASGTAGNAVVATTTPTLTVPAASDPDGDPVQYNFTISGGGDGPTGRASSGWQSAPSWTVPAGVLADGQAYTWNVATGDGPLGTPTATTLAHWANTLTVNQRLGGSTATPSDALGGVSVNLASGNATVSVAPHSLSTVAGELGVGFTYNSRAVAQSGLLGQYYPARDRNFTWPTAGSPSLVRVDPTLDMNWNEPGTSYPTSPPGLPVEQFMIQWTGYLTLPAGLPAGAYQVGVVSDDASAVYLNNSATAVVSTATMPYAAGTAPAYSPNQTLTPGTAYPIKIQYVNGGGPGRFSFYIRGTDATTSAAVGQQITPSAWLSPSLSALPSGWALSLPGGAAGYTHLAAGTATDANVVVLTDGGGASHTWTVSPTGGYKPPAGEDGTLTRNADKTYTLADSDGSLYTFDAAGNPQTASSATDTVHPSAATYTYDTSSTPKVIQVKDPVSGKSIKLVYGSTACPTAAGYDPATAIPANTLCQVQYLDSAGGVLDTTDLLYWKGMLSSVVEPGNEVTQFGYVNGLMTQVKSPLALDWQSVDPTNRETFAVDQLVSTLISYRWVQPAGTSNIRPAFAAATADVNGLYPAGSVPLVTSVQGPSPDGTATGLRPGHSYTYLDGDTSMVGGSTTWVANRTQVSTAGIPAGSSTVTSDVTYDPQGRTVHAANATGQSSSAVWDANDQPLVSTDAAGRVATSVYDWAQRPTDTYGPAPSSPPGTAGSCFQGSGLPVASPPASCGTIAHTHTGYDTTPTGTRITGLEATGYTTPNLTMPTTTPASAPVRATVPALSPAAETSLGTAVKSSRYSGEIALAPGSYTFSAQVGDKANDGVRLYLDDQLVIDRWNTLRQAVLGDNPTAYWRLGDATGSATAAAETGPVSGAASNVGFGAPANPANVDQTSTASFNGTSSSITLPSGLISATNHPTIEMWFKTTSPGALFGYQQAANGAATSANYVPALYVGADGRLRGLFWKPAEAAQPVTTPGAVTDNTWHHVVLTSADSSATGSTQSMYLDGALIGTTTGQIQTGSLTNDQIGAAYAQGWPSAPNGGGWSYFNGQIADVAIYTTGLSTQQVAAHTAAGNATLTHVVGMGAETFTTAGLAVAAGTLPLAPVSVPHKIRVEYRNPVAATPNLTLWATPAGSSAAQVPATAYDPRYGLATYTATDDTGGITPAAGQPAQTITGTSYSGGGLDPVYGLATDQIVDPAGLALDTKTAYEAPGSTSGYMRPTATALPSASLTGTAQSRTIAYYGDTETRANPCAAGSPAINQGGLAKLVTDPAPATGTAITHEVVYDAEGHALASRVVADGGWTCTTYDTRYRVSQVTVPSLNGAPARTTTYDYAVGGDPLVSSVSDSAGTITTIVDLLGRTVSYTDVKNTTTTTTYDQAGRATEQVTTPAGGGAASTVATTYLNDGRVSTVAVDGTLVSQPAYDANAEMTGAAYPAVTGTGAGPAPAFVQQASTHGHNQSSVSVTPTAALGAGNRLIVEVGMWSTLGVSATAATVSDSAGDVFTEVLHYAAADRTEMSIWTAPITSGAGTQPQITATPTSIADVGVVAMEYSGLSATGTGVDVTAQDTGLTTTAATVSSGTSPAATGTNEIALGFYTDSGAGDTLTAGTGYTQRANVSPNYEIEMLTADQPVANGATATATTGTGANTTWLDAVVVFKAAPTTGGNTSTAVSTITKNPQGAETGIAYALPGHTVSDSVTRSQAGRVMTDTAVKDGAAISSWAYTYDSAARLTQGVLAANGATPATTYAYAYASTGGCGADPAAGMDGARSSSTVTVGTGAPVTTTSCTDYASRLTSATGGGAMTYNTHGDATTIGTQSFTYDSSDRVVAGTAGGTNQTVTYTLDATGRTVTRVGSGTAPGVDVSTTTYSYTGDGDTPDLQLTPTGTIGERYLSLPGGVLYTKRYAATGGDIWAFPNIHGDTLATTDATGTLTGAPAIYDPYGNPLSQTTGVVDLTTDPTTRTGGLTDGWEGSHQRGAEHTGSANWILMGARIYLPGYGQFASTDPVFGGNTNPYTYPTDPINFADLTGLSWASWGHWLGQAAKVAAVVGFAACIVASGGVCAAVALAGAAISIGARVTNHLGGDGSSWRDVALGSAFDLALARIPGVRSGMSVGGGRALGEATGELGSLLGRGAASAGRHSAGITMGGVMRYAVRSTRAVFRLHPGRSAARVGYQATSAYRSIWR